VTYPLRFRKQTDTVANGVSYIPDAANYGYFELEFTGGSGAAMLIDEPTDLEEDQPLLFVITCSGTITSGIHGPNPWYLTKWTGPGSVPQYGAGPIYIAHNLVIPPGIPQPPIPRELIIDGHDWYAI
jgi:hypothetical protein